MRFIFLRVLWIQILIFTSGLVMAGEELPIPLPKSEGSKSFDMEISLINGKGLHMYEREDFHAARDFFSKAESLARQFRDPGLGAISFNLGLTLHKLNLHEEAVEAFATAKKFARGNRSILDSNLIAAHECGFNPSIPCDHQPPANMHIEGSN